MGLWSMRVQVVDGVHYFQNDENSSPRTEEEMADIEMYGCSTFDKDVIEAARTRFGRHRERLNLSNTSLQ